MTGPGRRFIRIWSALDYFTRQGLPRWRQKAPPELVALNQQLGLVLQHPLGHSIITAAAQPIRIFLLTWRFKTMHKAAVLSKRFILL